MIIECAHCESKVDGLAVGEISSSEPDYPYNCRVVLVQCPVCKRPLLGESEEIQLDHDQYGWSNLTRLWPKQEATLDKEIPEIAGVSLLEARLCFKAKAYSACAVMCGRTIEGVCKHFSTKAKNLAAGLKELREKGLIDERLYQWGDVLRNHRNIGAHATVEKVSREDARDLLDFSAAICEYVFVLSQKFERFRSRQAKA